MSSVRRLVALGRIASVPVSPSGKRRMIPADEVDRYILENTEVRAAPAPPPVVISKAREDLLRRAGWSGDWHL
jgi:hypothetical protein